MRKMTFRKIEFTDAIMLHAKKLKGFNVNEVFYYNPKEHHYTKVTQLIELEVNKNDLYTGEVSLPKEYYAGVDHNGFARFISDDNSFATSKCISQNLRLVTLVEKGEDVNGK